VTAPTVPSSLPLDGAVTEASLAAAASRVTKAALDAGAAPADLAARFLGWHDDAVTVVRRRLPLAQPHACAPGCAHCCRLKVTLTPLEALSLLAELRKAGPETLSRLKRKVKEADKLTRGKTAEERLRLALPCPLLDDAERCVAYGARPLSCAGTNSFDAEGCRKAVAGEGDAEIAHDPVAPRVASAIAGGVTEATFVARRDGRILELVAALRLGLDDPDVRAKWTRGEPVFQAAMDPEFAATIR
jgi:Fe-S-cluster containining protein